MSREFSRRHIGPWGESRQSMLDDLGYKTMEDLVDLAVPGKIKWAEGPSLPPALSETQALEKLREMLGKNRVLKSYIGQGYYGTMVPPVIQRNILENPGWYTAYTPYQAEISQGRLEALLNFQTMVVDLTGMDIANSSLLDESTAAAEAMSLALTAKPRGSLFWVDEKVHPQTLDVIKTRAEPLGVEVKVGPWQDFQGEDGFFAALVQYPSTLGDVDDFTDFAKTVHEAGGLLIVAADLLALTILKEPGAMGADICVGSTQRFGVPMGYGGPHAGYISCQDALKRKLPGRIIGVSIDSQGKPGYRLSLQTREQHIRRDKATSNICTAQVLLAVMASMYAVWHGPQGLKTIANQIHQKTCLLAAALKNGGYELVNDSWFDTLTIRSGEKTAALITAAENAGYHFRQIGDATIGISLDETTTAHDLAEVMTILEVSEKGAEQGYGDTLTRQSDILAQEVFHKYHSETDMMRYIRRLEGKDLALNEAMIPLGSCTMKLNAAAEMMPVTWPEVGNLHPFIPAEFSVGMREMLEELSDWLAEITGFAAVSLQPNAGSQGEYAGLLAIRSYHRSRGDQDRTICLIPSSAHGTNPASAIMAGYKVVPVKCDEEGNIDHGELTEKIEKHRDQLGALMVTYPSTHGVYEEGIIDICQQIHDAGGLVYMDGANMNAQVGLTSPGLIGADVCHLNLHKTFCIPHGGGGPGVGPIGVVKHLEPFLPGHRDMQSDENIVCSAAYGSASINVISWMYIAMMGPDGLKEATQVAILNANYMAHRLKNAFPVLYKGRGDLVAHECIIDTRPATEISGVTVEDVAKRLIDYGFHAPTMSWPVAGTLMIEPTESESLEEIDRFCDAMLAIHQEIQAIASGEIDREDNPLKNAPHTAEMVITDDWNHPYSREQAAYPVPGLRQHKFWPSVGRVDNVHGDRNLVCTCGSVESYTDE